MKSISALTVQSIIFILVGVFSALPYIWVTNSSFHIPGAKTQQGCDQTALESAGVESHSTPKYVPMQVTDSWLG